MTRTLFAAGGLSIERLRSFLLVADKGGYAAAAPNHPTRQSQLCRQVGELEEFFGQPLTDRRGRRLVVTEVGERLATLTRDVLKELEALVNAGAEPHPPVHVDLGAGDSVLHWWVLPRIAAVLATVPNVTVSFTSLSSADVVRRLGDASLDVGIVHAGALPKPAGRAMQSRSLGTLEYAVFVSRARMREAGARTLDEVLARVPLAMQTSESTLNDCLKPHAPGGALRPALACETFPQACRAVRSGSYAALLPLLAREELPAKDFAALPEDGFAKTGARLLLAWHPRFVRQRRRGAEIVEALERGLKRADALRGAPSAAAMRHPPRR